MHDDPVRLRLYQRFSAVEADEQLASLVSEVEDRFGTLAEPAQQLVYLTSLRLRAAEVGVEALTATHDESDRQVRPPASAEPRSALAYGWCGVQTRQ